ncbi:MAG: hypothetical protein M1833_004784 [Piccolia ochrophora]|nr:MAG: hypothetical protein M1833_004784 [Piccolia ochrophora]
MKALTLPLFAGLILVDLGSAKKPVVGNAAPAKQAKWPQTLTEVNMGQPPTKTTVWIPEAGKTSSLASTSAAGGYPTLVYNCKQMPLICENAKEYLNTNGKNFEKNSDGAYKLHYDPDGGHLRTRRDEACHDGKFCPDSCKDATTAGKKVSDIAKDWMPPKDLDPKADYYKSINDWWKKQVVKLNLKNAGDVPGRIWAPGYLFTCDEFPAASWIEGGAGAGTTCALQNWFVMKGPKRFEGLPNMDPMPRAEQDWQAAAHGRLQNGFGKKKDQAGKIFPFWFSTVDSAPDPTKAYIIYPETYTEIQKTPKKTTIIHTQPFQVGVTKRAVPAAHTVVIGPGAALPARAVITPSHPTITPMARRRRQVTRFRNKAIDPATCTAGQECIGVDPVPSITVVTEVIDGDTEIGTFFPTTIPEYTTLTAPTTITTDFNGAAVPLVIAAGGVAWWGVVPKGIPPPVDPPGPDIPDDDTPPNDDDDSDDTPPDDEDEDEDEPTSVESTSSTSEPTAAVCIVDDPLEEPDNNDSEEVPEDEDSDDEEDSDEDDGPAPGNPDYVPPVTEIPDPKCDDGGEGKVMPKDERKGDFEKFCGDHKGHIITPLSTSRIDDEYNHDRGRRLKLVVEWDFQNCLGVHPKESVLDEDTCKMAFEKLSDSCGVPGTEDVKGGAVAASCIKYTATVTSTEILNCGGASEFPDAQCDMKRDDAMAAIENTCSRDRKLTAKDNSFHGFSQDDVDTNNIHTSNVYNDILYSVSINWNPEVKEDDRYDITIKTDDCKRILGMIIDGCPDFVDLSKKHGGWVWTEDEKVFWTFYGAVRT